MRGRIQEKVSLVKVFVYEQLSGGGLCGEPLPESLAREGWAMLRALVADLAILNGYEVVVTVDHRLPANELPANVEAVIVSERREAQEAFAAAVERADGTCVIAPELDDELARRCEAVEALGGRLLGAPAAAIRRATDKLLLPALLASAGIPALETVPIQWEAERHSHACTRVIKPRFGAGSTDLYVTSPGAALPKRPATDREWVSTRFEPGLAASVLTLVGPQEVVALRAGRQFLSTDGRLRYLGGELPLEPHFENRARHLARRAVEAIPGLRGFIGVDLVLSSAGTSASADLVVEINARLTTSYVGLRALARDNLASAWLRVLDGIPCGELRWDSGRISFHPETLPELVEQP